MKGKIIQYTLAELNSTTPISKDARLITNNNHNHQVQVELQQNYSNKLRVKNLSGVQVGISLFSSKDEIEAYLDTNRYVDLIFNKKLMGAEATGLANDATIYTASFALDTGAIVAISITGSTAQTWTDLVTQLNADLVGASASLVDGNNYIRIVASATTTWHVGLWDSGANLLTEGLNMQVGYEHNSPFLIDHLDTFTIDGIGRPHAIVAKAVSGVATASLNIELQSYAW